MNEPAPRVIDRFKLMHYLNNKPVQGRPLQAHHLYGIAANVKQECDFNGFLWGDNKQAFGLCQWHPVRRADFNKVYDKSMTVSTVWEQLDFMLWELNNTEKTAGRKLLDAITAYEAGAVFSKYYERPKRVELEMKNRGRQAQKWWDEDNKPVSKPGALA